MRKKVFFLIFTSSILLVVSFSYYFYGDMNNIKIKKETESKKNIKEKLKEDDVIESIKNSENDDENHNDDDSNDSISYNKNNANNMESNNASSYNVIKDNSNNESNNNTSSSNTSNNSVNNYIPQAPVSESVRELTEWEKLGISEYDYYNTPSDNEGELAFKGNTNLCQNEINRLVNKYYDSGIDGGNYYTINGKYTHSYLGCGIKMYMNGNIYTYNQIKSMGFN